MKIVIDQDIPYIKGIFESYSNVLYRPGALITNADVRDADALIVRTRTMCNSDLLSHTDLKYIATATIGFDHIDVAQCAALGIEWSNAAGCNAMAVCQYVIANILEVAHAEGIDLHGKCLGIIGCGHVGSLLAKHIGKYGMTTLLSDPPLEDLGQIAGVNIDQLFEQADFISIHTPLSHGGLYPTYHLVTDRLLKKMKPRTVFMNTSRGEVVDTKSLIAILKSRPDIRAIIDVWENEPDIDLELLELVKVATPHIAGYSIEGKTKATSMAVQAVAHKLGISELMNWKPAINSKTNVLPNSEDKDYQKIMHQLFKERYNVMTDVSALREHPENFEQLRKEYDYRYELNI